MTLYGNGWPVGPRIMLCATDAPGRDQLSTTLSDKGYETERCWSGEELMDRVSRRPPDVVVYALPARADADLALLRQFRELKPRVPLILVTPDDSMRLRDAALKLRPAYFAIEPVDGAEMCDAVRAVTLDAKAAH